MNHELIDRIEFFLFFSDQVVFADSNDRELFWVGCVKGPKDSAYFNDVVISDKNGSFYATHQYDKDWGFSKLFIFNIFRWDTGYVYEWNKELGYSILNNSDSDSILKETQLSRINPTPDIYFGGPVDLNM